LSAPGNITDEIKMRRSAVAFIGNSVAALNVLVIGYPLAPAAIRTMLIGWILIAAGATRFILGHHFQTTGTGGTTTMTRVRSTDCGRYR
jgi:uncharacterized membrane protein HdeD (DUF308 family)